jgi:hypothetical protein
MANDRRPILSELADKSGVKIRIEKQIGSKYVIPTYAVVETESELDFVKYPREFALKPTHGSQAGILVHEQCKRSEIPILPNYDTWGKYFEIHPDDLDLNLGFIKIMTKRWLNSKYRPDWEICYNAIAPRVIVEKYIKPNPPNFLTDFRFYTFHGEVKFFRTATGYTNDIPHYAYDVNGVFLPVKADHDEVELARFGNEKQKSLTVSKGLTASEMVKHYEDACCTGVPSRGQVSPPAGGNRALLVWGRRSQSPWPSAETGLEGRHRGASPGQKKQTTGRPS